MMLETTIQLAVRHHNCQKDFPSSQYNSFDFFHSLQKLAKRNQMNKIEILCTIYYTQWPSHSF